ELCKLVSLGGGENPNQTRPVTGQRDERERSGCSMKFRRRVVVRTGMSQANGQCSLRVTPLLHRDASGLTADRFATVSDNDEWSAQNDTAFERDHDVIDIWRDADGIVIDKPELGQSRCVLVERSDQMVVLDIVAENVQVDLFRGEFHFRRAP